jgi:Mechanosensitive ion channel, beta-domain
MALYRYELRRDQDVVATGHISFEQPLQVGDRVTIGTSQGIVQSVTPTLQDRELQLIVQLLPSDTDT